MNYKLTTSGDSRRQAVTGIMHLNLESNITSNVIETFRNVFPSVRNYISEVILEFKTHDETDFNFNKISSYFSSAESVVKDINFVKFGHTLLQTPEGFKGRYVEYLSWLDKQGMNFIDESMEILGDYYRRLSVFISSREAKLDLKDHTRYYSELQKALDGVKDGLGTFFDSKTSNALRTAESLFDRASDISMTVKLAKDLNRKRMTIKTKEISSLTQQIADLINLLVESSETDAVPEVSGAAATSISQGALVVAHYVEFIGVLHYRIEEAINAVGIMAEQVTKKMKETA